MSEDFPALTVFLTRYGQRVIPESEFAALTAERDAALARAERAEAMVVTLREALDHLYRATYESDEIIDGDCAGVVTRPNPEWRPFPSHDALRAVLADTEAAATATIERIRAEALTTEFPRAH